MTKNELKEIIILDLLIKSKQRQLKELKEQKFCVKAINYKPDKLSPTNAVSNPQEDLLLKIVDLESSIQKDITKLIKTKRKAANTIKNIKGIERVVLEMRYLECMTWEEIAFRLTYNIRSVYKIHGRALQLIKRGQ